MTPSTAAMPRRAAAPAPRSAAAIALTALLCLGGCWSNTRLAAPAQGPSAPPPAITWPARDLAPVQDLAERTPRLVSFATPHPPDADWSPDFAVELMGRPLTLVDQTIVGKGMIRRLASTAPLVDDRRWSAFSSDDRLDRDDTGAWLANAAFISSRTIAARTDNPHDQWRARVREQFNRVLALHDAPARLSSDRDDLLIGAGLPLRLPPHDAAPTRGIIIHFNSIQLNRFETELLDRIADRGWAVIHIATSAWIDSGHRQEDLDRAASARKEALQRLTSLIDDLPAPTTIAGDDDAQRETAARARLQSAAHAMDRLRRQARLADASDITVRPAGFDLCSHDTPEDVGRRIAGHVDQTIAGHVYAAEAALLIFDQTRPDLAHLPVVILGCSAGAFTVPAAAARLGSRVAAAVVIGGGADIFTIARTSSLTSAGLILRCGDRPAPADHVRRAHQAYLAATQLDPIRLAPLLEGTPTLQLHADLDRIVPASTGRLLSERLGPHHRRTLLGGHNLLFLLLPTQADTIALWLEQHVPAPKDSTRARTRQKQRRPVRSDGPTAHAQSLSARARQGRQTTLRASGS